jgi:protein-disulfide isomerase
VRVAGAIRGPCLAAALALVAGAAFADPPPAHEPDDMVLGSPRAPVTVIEYASVGCPHCAAWNNTVFPDFRAKYVATGRVRFVMREMLTGVPSIATAGFMLARCAGPTKYFQVVDAIFHRQGDMFQPGAAAGPVLEDIAKSAGLDEPAFQACLNDQKGLDALNARVQRHVDEDKVDSTPIFFVGGRRYEGEQTLAQLATAIHAARHAR